MGSIEVIMKKVIHVTQQHKKIFMVVNLVYFMMIFPLISYSHEDGGEKDIRCSVIYQTEAEMDTWGLNKKEGGDTLYTITVTPAVSMSFLNDHVDIGIMPEMACVPMMEGQEFCLPWETANVEMAPSLEFIAETKNGIQITGKYAILNFQDPPRIKAHPSNHKNSVYISKKQHDEAEIKLNYCILIY